jgi:uncharacterized membrane protein HdeD (DUF308 family)
MHADANHAERVMTAHQAQRERVHLINETKERQMSTHQGALDSIGLKADRSSRPLPLEDPFRAFISRVARYWWVELAVGVLWLVIAAVVLKFDHASVVTVGVLTGVMFLLFAAQDFVLAAMDPSAMRWLWGLFGGLMSVAGVVALIQPVATFYDFAEILGFVFMLIGVMWMVRAFSERVINDLWWLTLTSGILMIVMAFWVSGQFFLTRAYTLLVFAGIWALMAGITAIVRAFQLRRVASDA